MAKIWKSAITILLILLPFGDCFAEPQSPYAEFVQKAFSNNPPQKPKTLWLNKAIKEELESLFDYRFSTLRLRYWQNAETSAWILEEIGKEEFITMGLVVNAGVLQSVEVLEYRESRGGEIQYPFFTKQFDQARLETNDGKIKLDRHIDGITGATLSVRAMTKVAKVALYLHAKVNEDRDVAQSAQP